MPRAAARARVLAFGVSVVALGACADEGQGPVGYKVQVAPLDLPGISDACYSLTVYNSESVFDATTTVWSLDQVCASQYGDGSGSITYIGTCDATFANNTVELVLEDLYTGGTFDDDGEALTAADYENPCTSADPAHTCRLVRPCVENADTLVEFNLTIMRSANQGFFDIAVNFEDIFCSAKVDCLGSDDEPLDLLFNGDERDSTAVMAFACSAGEGADTTMYLSDVYIVCDHDTTNNTLLEPDRTSVVAQLSPSAGPGQMGSPAPGIFEYAVYNGHEELPGLNKQYSNMAIGIEDSFFQTTFNGATVTRSCQLVAWGSASDGLWPAAMSPLDSTTPVVTFNIPLNPPATVGGAAQTTLSCGRHPMDGDGSGVITTYDTVASETCFENVVDGNWDEVDGELETTHYLQWQRNNGEQWHPWMLTEGFESINDWQTTGIPQISRCEESWDRTNRQLRTFHGPVDYGADNGTIAVTACRDSAPFNGICDVGEPTFAGAEFAAVSGYLMPAGHVSGVTTTGTSDGTGIATLSSLLPGNYYLRHAPSDTGVLTALFCSGTGMGYNPPPNWPIGFVVGSPQDKTSFDFAVRCQ